MQSGAVRYGWNARRLDAGRGARMEMLGGTTQHSFWRCVVVIVPVDEIRNGKPDPEGFLRAAEELGVAPEDCLVFEDTRPGIDAGLSAGMQVVGLLTTFSAQELRHQPLIGDFRVVAIRREGEFLKIELSDRMHGVAERGSDAGL